MILRQPVSIRQPEIGELVAGAMTVLIRPIGRLAVLQQGDLLWVREPFHVAKRFAHLRPSLAAAAPGCEPVFVADHKPAYFAHHAPELGRRRHARELPKAWHRQHLAITAIDRVQLHGVTERDLRTAGWKSRGAFEMRWDQDAAGFFGTRGNEAMLYEANPSVLRITFTRIAAPLPGYDAGSCAATLRSRGGAAPAASRPLDEAPSMRRFAAPDRAPCPRCGIRRDRGCEHFPLTAEARP